MLLLVSLPLLLLFWNKTGTLTEYRKLSVFQQAANGQTKTGVFFMPSFTSAVTSSPRTRPASQFESVSITFTQSISCFLLLKGTRPLAAWILLFSFSFLFFVFCLFFSKERKTSNQSLKLKNNGF